jgi:Lon-like ATP-dependent protease
MKTNRKEAAAKGDSLELDVRSTAEIPVSKRLIDQVVGQEASVEIIKKAAAQKRNVLLIGLPGTGKSMIAQAMAEILPIQQLQDILVYPNNADPNNPKVRMVRAGEGKKIVQSLRLEALAEDDNTRMIGTFLTLAWFIFSYLSWRLGWVSDVIYAALLILGALLVVGFSLGTQMRPRQVRRTPKLLIDNAGKKIAPFSEATGARAGALLGDVRHDPLQCHYGFNKLYLQKKSSFGTEMQENTFIELWEELYPKYKARGEIIHNEQGYEAFHLSEEDKLFTLGYKDGKTVWSRILSLNRQPFEGKIVDIKTGDNTVSLTPEHKMVLPTKGKAAEEISKDDPLIVLDVKKQLAVES